jgi:predicted ribosome quality control (RQC) complex YloA/Tae2 family protein
VGRDEGENGVLEAHALRRGLPWMEVSDYMGPITVLMGGVDESSLKLGAAITARYSDAPRDEVVAVELHGAAVRVLETASITDEELERYRV